MSEAPNNNTSQVAKKDMPLKNKKKTYDVIRRYKKFSVPPETFRKFETGRNKFERWSKYLDLEDGSQKAVYDYAKKNPKNTIILTDATTGAMRSIRKRSSNGL
jgi:hypothetical protein